MGFSLESVLNEIILGQCVLSLVLELVSVFCFSSILYVFFVKKLTTTVASSPVLLLYILMELSLAVTTILYVLYLIVCWDKDQVRYNAYILYSVGGVQNLVMTVAPVCPFFLGLERCLCVWFPTKYNQHKRRIAVGAAFAVILVFLAICVFLRILANIPTSSVTLCQTLGCMMSNESGQVYTALRYTAGIGNLAVGIVLGVIIRKFKASVQKGYNLVMLTLLMTFICDLCPHIISFLSYTCFDYNASKSLGLYSLLASAIESCCCGLFYRHSVKPKQTRVSTVHSSTKSHVLIQKRKSIHTDNWVK